MKKEFIACENVHCELSSGECTFVATGSGVLSVTSWADILEKHIWPDLDVIDTSREEVQRLRRGTEDDDQVVVELQADCDTDDAAEDVEEELMDSGQTSIYLTRKQATALVLRLRAILACDENAPLPPVPSRKVS